MNILPISSSVRKSVASLAQTKHRRRSGLFMAEGTKCVADTCHHFECISLCASAEWLDAHRDIAERFANVYKANSSDMARMTALATPSDVIAVYAKPEYIFNAEMAESCLVLALDRVQDPGNLGTIIRVSDWMGVTDIIASSDTVDAFSPKVIQSTMGSISRVRVHYVDLPDVLKSISQRNIPVYGTFLNGTSIYKSGLSENGVIVMGNEGQGISAEVAGTVSRRILLPSFPPERPTAESLNVAVATSLTLAEFRRRQFCE